MHKHPVLRGRQNAEERSQHIADKLMVLQKHLRQVAADVQSIEQSGLPQYQKAALQTLFSKMKASNLDVDGPESSEVKKRKLEPTLSVVTTDSQGWPLIPGLQATEQNSEEELLLENEEENHLPCTKKEIKETFKKPAAATACLKKPAMDLSGSKAGASPAAKNPTVKTDFKLVMKDLKLNGPFAEKSYIVQKINGKPVLAVACVKKQSKHYHKVLQTVMDNLKKKSEPTKSVAVALRDKALEKYG